jgi:hypothetical protein
MHIIRILGWQDIERTEIRIARLLSKEKTVRLKTVTRCAISTSLVLHSVNKSTDGKVKVQEIINECKERLTEAEHSTS